MNEKYYDEEGERIDEGNEEEENILEFGNDALDILDDLELTTDDGSLFKVDIPDHYQMLDEQEIFRNQSLKTQRAIRKIFKERGINLSDNMTGRKIYEAISKTFDEDIHKGSIQASKLLNENGVKGITYDGRRDGRCYVVFDDKAIKILEKFNLRGTGDTTLKNFVADEKLTSQQKLLKDFSGQMGMTLQFFKNDNADFRGAYTNGITYLTVNSNIPLGQVFWHETLHWLKANNPKLFKNLADAANLSEEQLENYLDETGRKDLKDNAEITEEILADSLHKLLDKVHDRNLLEKIIAWIRDTLSKFKEKFHNRDGDLKTVQYERMANTFGNIAKNLTDEDGNKIFRFNSRTKKLELANGHQLPKTDLRFDDSEKFIDNEADMNENTEQEVFDKYLVGVFISDLVGYKD